MLMSKKMLHATRPSASPARMQTKMSAWTPLNHSLSNSKVFEERRSLLAKWVREFKSVKRVHLCSDSGGASRFDDLSRARQFARWSDRQRRLVLRDFVEGCSKEQLRFVERCVSRQLPLLAADFTCLLPRAICLYIFSFLDPRSLCRCARVSWHWKSIVELDQLWMPKCLRLGWFISFSPTVFEQGVWKRHYINSVQEILLAAPTKKLQAAWPQQQTAVQDAAGVGGRREDVSQGVSLSEGLQGSTNQDVGVTSRSRFKKDKHATVLPPWRDSDRCPKDIVRFNYLDNSDPVGQTSAAKTKSRATTCGRKTEEPDDRRQKTVSETTYKLRKAKSLMFLTSSSRPQPPFPPPPPPLQTESRPQWASHTHNYPITKEEGEILLRQVRCNAGKRPGPVRTTVPRLSVEALRASQRSNRSLPSAPLFEFQPWTLPLSLTHYVD
ncbi:F-box only protein 16 isoform X2 [Hippocampus comes]|uniref:F-box only protein 16 isoform X2 n=1 Tax=Hippocampus comes TaxID=109280 RepID=UPI00094E811C|nr:PREDICTED: F-box only protein 16 isoform X2 [Hippocampus comes]